MKLLVAWLVALAASLMLTGCVTSGHYQCVTAPDGHWQCTGGVGGSPPTDSL